MLHLKWNFQLNVLNLLIPHRGQFNQYTNVLVSNYQDIEQSPYYPVSC